MTPTQTQVRLLLCTLIVSTSVLGIQGSWFADDEDEDWRAEALAKFKAFAEQIATEDFMKNEVYLLRWLKALDFDLDVAISSLGKTVQWRKANNMSSIIYETFTPTFLQEFEISMDGSEDKQGRPIMYVPLGRYNLRKGTIGGHQSTIIRYFTRALEIGERYIHLKRVNDSRYRDISQVAVLLDLHGFNLVSTGCWKCLQIVPEMVPVLENFYRQLFSEIIFINAPKIFDVMLNLMKSLMTEGTRESVQVYDPNSEKWKPALLERISLENLPLIYGGTRPKTRGTEVENMIIEDGKLRQKGVGVTKEQIRASDSTIHFSSTAEHDEIERLVSSTSASASTSPSPPLPEVSVQVVNTTFTTARTVVETPAAEEEAHIRHHKHNHHHHYSRNGGVNTKETVPHSLSTQNLEITQESAEKFHKKPVEHTIVTEQDETKSNIDETSEKVSHPYPEEGALSERTPILHKSARATLNNSRSSAVYSYQQTLLQVTTSSLVIIVFRMRFM